MRGERSITGFRRRLKRLIDEQCEGQYTRLARRAGIPVSSMEHIMLTAKRLPGGDQLLRLAATLGVTVQDLVAGHEGGHPADDPAPPAPAVLRRAFAPPIGNAPHRSLPVFRCGCPDGCPLTSPVPPVATARSRAVLPRGMLARFTHHRLIGLEVGPCLECAEWPTGTQLVIDWDARTPAWKQLVLFHTAGRCRLGHVVQTDGCLLFAASRVEDAPQVVGGESRILGTTVAVIALL